MVIGDNIIIVIFIVVKCGIINKFDEESFVYNGKEFNLYIYDFDKKVIGFESIGL